MRGWLALLYILSLCAPVPLRADEAADWKSYNALKKAVSEIPKSEGKKRAALYVQFFAEHPQVGPWVGAKACADVAAIHYAAKDLKTAWEVVDWAGTRWPKHPALVEVLSAKAAILVAENRAAEVETLFNDNWDLLTQCRADPVVRAADLWLQALQKQGKKEEIAPMLERVLLGCPILVEESQQWNQGFLYDRLHERLLNENKADDDLAWAALRFRLCRFNTVSIERSTKQLASAFMLKDPSRKLGRAFVDAQTNPEAKNPLLEIELPKVDAETLKAQLAHAQGDWLFHERITLLLLGGNYLQSLTEARRYMIREPDKPDGPNAICRTMKCHDGSLRRANAFAEWMRTGDGPNPLDAFAKELEEKPETGPPPPAPAPAQGAFPGGPAGVPLTPAAALRRELDALMRLPFRGVAPAPVDMAAVGAVLPVRPFTPSPVQPAAAAAGPAPISQASVAASFGLGAVAPPSGTLPQAAAAGPVAVPGAGAKGAVAPVVVRMAGLGGASGPAIGPVSERALTLRFTVGDIARGALSAEAAWKGGSITADDAVAILNQTPQWQDEDACVQIAGLLAAHAPERLDRAAEWNGLARYRLAQYYRRKRDARAVPLYESVLGEIKRPAGGFVPSVIDLGLYYVETGDRRRALETFESADRYCTDKRFPADCRLEAARCHAALGDEGPARELYAVALADGDDWIRGVAASDLAGLLLKQGDSAAAIETLRGVSAAGPVAVVVSARLGYSYYRAGDLANARVHCEAAVQQAKALGGGTRAIEARANADQAARTLRWIAFWEKTPAYCEPAEIVASRVPGTVHLAVRACREGEVRVAPSGPGLRLTAEESWQRPSPYFTEKRFTVAVAPEALVAGAPTALRVSVGADER